MTVENTKTLLDFLEMLLSLGFQLSEAMMELGLTTGIIVIRNEEEPLQPLEGDK